MKKYSTLRKGFTLVELMIVIAIIGVLAAVLYPSLSGYINGARDSNRVSALKNISLSLAGYQQEHGKFPVAKACINDLRTTLGSHAKNINTDPTNGFGVEACKTSGGFEYTPLATSTLNANDGGAYMLAARLEQDKNANITSTQYANITHIEGSADTNKNASSVLNTNKGTKPTFDNTKLPYHILVN